MTVEVRVEVSVFIQFRSEGLVSDGLRTGLANDGESR